MKWFDRWLARKVRRGLEQEKIYEEKQAINSIKQAASHPRGLIMSDGGLESPADLNFRMYRAYNGYVMEVRHNDRRTDRTVLNIHIIPDGEDLGDHIAKIITLESLKVS